MRIVDSTNSASASDPYSRSTEEEGGFDPVPAAIEQCPASPIPLQVVVAEDPKANTATLNGLLKRWFVEPDLGWRPTPCGWFEAREPSEVELQLLNRASALIIAGAVVDEASFTRAAQHASSNASEQLLASLHRGRRTNVA